MLSAKLYGLLQGPRSPLLGGSLTRRQPAIHKRLMLFGTMATIGQATGRIPVLFGFPEGAFGTAGPIPLAFPLVLVVHDLWSENRVHRATIWGLVFMACCLALAPIVGRSSLGSRILDALR